MALLACAMAAESVWAIFHNTVSMSYADGVSSRIPNANFLFLVLAFVSALCAWGIFKWRSWGYILALEDFRVRAIRWRRGCNRRRH